MAEITFTPSEKKPTDSAAAAPPSAAPGVSFTPSGSAATSKQPSSPAMHALGDVGRDIWHDIHQGFTTMEDGWKDLQKNNSIAGDLKAGAEYAGGAAEMGGAALTGTVRALFSDPLRKVIPQDHPAGKMVVNAAEDAVLMFGPEAIAPIAKAVKTASGPVRRMLEAGVTLTPGQLDPMFAKRGEEAARSLPLVGSFLRKAYERTLDSFNVATVKRVVNPLGDLGDAKNGREAMIKAHDMADKRYEQIRQSVPALQQDNDMVIGTKILQMELSEGDPQIATRVNNFINNRMEPKWDSMTQAMNGQDFKAVESELTKQINQNRYSTPENQEYARRLTEIRDLMRGGVERQYPKVAEALKEVNAVYARLADIDYAQAARKGGQGRFTPGDLLTGIRRQDRSPRHVQFNEGNRPMQQWAEDAHTVIGDKLPDSGTAERVGWGVLEGSIEGGAAWMHPGTLAALGGTAAVYSGPGQRAVSDLALNAGQYSKNVGSFVANAAPVGSLTRQAQEP